MPSTMPMVDSRPACEDGRIGELAELTGIDCVHLDDVSAEDAKLALLGVALYHHLESAGRRAVDQHIDSLPTGFRGAVRRAKENHQDGAVIYENDSGSQQIVQGRRFDYAALGIEPQRIRAHDTDFHYALIDGNFVFFPDNPHLYYYIQSARQGKLNVWTAAVAREVARFFPPGMATQKIKTIPGLRQKLEKLEKTKEKLTVSGFFMNLFFAQDKIPIWGDILGTPIPSTGTTTILIYVSDDRENWDRRIRFEVKSDGVVQYQPWKK